MYKVIRAGSRHATAIAEFNQAMASETEGKSLPWNVIHPGVLAMLDDDSLGFYLVAVPANDPEAETIAGCLGITYEWSDWRNGLFWWIQSVYVLPEHREQGVFSSMYDEVKQLARQQDNICGIRLYVETENTRAQRTYQRLGMIEAPYRIMEEEF